MILFYMDESGAGLKDEQSPFLLILSQMRWNVVNETHL